MTGLAITSTEAIRRITIDRPDRGNSLTQPLVGELADAFEDAAGDPDVRAIVLTATGQRHFCTGSDLGNTIAGLQGAPERVAAPDPIVGLMSGFQRVVRTMMDCPKPVIVGLNGLAAGAGAQLVLAADVVVAAEAASIAQVFVKRGLVPDAGAAYLLTKAVGPLRAKQLCFRGAPLDARDALAWGLVTEVVDQEDLARAVDAWAAELANGPTIALGSAKWLINHAMDHSRDAAFWEEAYAMERVRRTDDSKEGVLSFAERRPPAFRGR